jgi:hypothetical protein
MRRLAIAIFLLGIAAGIVSLETIQRPYIFESAAIVSAQPVDKTGATPIEPVVENPTPAPPKDAVTTQSQVITASQMVDATTYFNADLLNEQTVTIGEGRYASSLFRHTSVNPNRDSFSLIIFPFSIDGRQIGTVSRILPTEEMSSGRLLALVRSKLETITTTNQEGGAGVWLTSPLRTIGEANFYLNDKIRFPDTVFLVSRENGKVLAFQYSSQYHEQVKKYVSLFFQ